MSDSSNLQYLREEYRFGLFHVHTENLFTVPGLRAFLGNCIIVRAERVFVYGPDTVEYQAFSPDIPTGDSHSVARRFEVVLAGDRFEFMEYRSPRAYPEDWMRMSVKQDRECPQCGR